MPSNTPNTRPTFPSEPFVANELSVEVGDFKGAVVEICLFDFRWSALHEEDMVVGICLAEIEMHEDENVDVGELRVIENVAGNEVEIGGVEVELAVEVFADVSKVT